MIERSSYRKTRNREKVSHYDGVSLAIIALALSLPHLANLGFYGEDWYVLSLFEAAANQGWSETAGIATSELFDSRPGQGFYAAFLHYLFGMQPLGYHVVNTSILAVAIALLYMLLIRLGISDFDSLAICLVAIVLPQFSTVRVWYSSFQIPLSFLLTLVSLHAQLLYLGTKRPKWIALALLMALLSLACYEIFTLPLLALSIALIMVRFDRGARPKFNKEWRTRAPLLIVAITLIFALFFKGYISGRTGPITDPVSHLKVAWSLIRLNYDWRIDGGPNIYAAISVNFWFVLVGWLDAAKGLVSGKVPPTVLVITSVITIFSFWRLRSALVSSQVLSHPSRLFVIGFATFGLGLAIFVIVPSIIFSPTGLGNRVLVAAGVGVAIVIVAIIRQVGQVIGQRENHYFLPFAISLIFGLGALRVAEVSAFWAEAPNLQKRTRIAAQKDLMNVPSGSTIILEGVCPYHGPAIVYETWWDTGPALSFAIGKKVRADTLSNRMSITPTGLRTSIYNMPRVYEYGPNLYAYNARDGVVVALHDVGDAIDHFSKRTAREGQCPRGYVGHGVLL